MGLDLPSQVIATIDLGVRIFNKSTIVSCFGNRKSSELIQRSTDAYDSRFESANQRYARSKSLPGQWHPEKSPKDPQNACTCLLDRQSALFSATNTSQPSKRYKYFRLYGVAGTTNFGGIAEATFNLTNTNRPSTFPKLNCSNDIDGDGITNHLDLDSDGDGCTDAKESFVSGTLTTGDVTNRNNGSNTTTSGVTNAIVVGDYGANGFADGYNKSAQDVIISSFLAAYTGKKASSSSLNSLPKIPLPNWRITYGGLSKIPLVLLLN